MLELVLRQFERGPRVDLPHALGRSPRADGKTSASRWVWPPEGRALEHHVGRPHVPWLRTASDSGRQSAAGPRVPTLEGRDEYRRYAPAGLRLHEDSAPPYGDCGRALGRGAPCEQ